MSIAVIGVTFVLFVAWVIFMIFRGAGRLMTAVFLPPRPPRLTTPDVIRCPWAGCHAHNPGDARYCRRCGRRFGKTN